MIHYLDPICKKKIRILTLVIASLLSILELWHSRLDWFSKDALLSFITLTAIIFFTLLPIFDFLRPKYRCIFERHIFLNILLILYLAFLVPAAEEIGKYLLSQKIDKFFIYIIHMTSLILAVFIILKTIIFQFIDIIFNKRVIKKTDVLVTFATYLTVGFAYGSFYYLLNTYSKTNLFSGIEKIIPFHFENYLNYIYISLGALSTVASGSITAVNVWVRLISVFETILGVFLTSFSLGIIFSVVGSNISQSNSELEKNPPETLTSRIKNYIKEVNNDFKIIEDTLNKKL